MNAGMFGLSEGSGWQSRKMVGRLTTGGASNALATNATALQSVGVSSSAVSTSANVRTLLTSVSGAGAIRYLALSNATGATANMTIEVVLDGSKAINQTTSVNGGNSFLAVGQCSTGTYANGVIFDYLPFSKSCEIYSTTSVANTGANYAYVIDVHQ